MLRKRKRNDQLFQHVAPTGPCSTFLGAHLGDTVCLCVRHTGPLCRCGYGGHFFPGFKNFKNGWGFRFKSFDEPRGPMLTVLSDLSAWHEVLLVQHTSWRLSRKAFVNLPMLPWARTSLAIDDIPHIAHQASVVLRRHLFEVVSFLSHRRSIVAWSWPQLVFFVQLAELVVEASSVF